MGFVTGLNRWIYAIDDEAIYANLFVGNETRMPWKNDTLKIVEDTSYPWDGQVLFTIDPGKPELFTFAIRIPGWTRDTPVPGGIYRYKDNDNDAISLKLNGSVIDPVIKDGYMRMSRKWNAGDRID